MTVAHDAAPIIPLYSEGDTITAHEALCLNALKHSQALASVFEKAISLLEQAEYIARYMQEAKLLVPTVPAVRSSIEKKARALLVKHIKELYKAKGLLIKGNTAQIEALADKIEPTERFSQFIKLAELQDGV